MHTFIVDDDHVSIFLTEQALRKAGVPKISTFLSAEQALVHLMKSPTDSLPDFILLDLNMPYMSGWDFLDALEPFEWKRWEKTKIYILTSSLDQKDSTRSNDYPMLTDLYTNLLIMRMCRPFCPNRGREKN
ncbi:response regulator [Pontibacter brevis]